MNYDSLEGLAQALFEESGDALFLFDPETDQLLDVNSTAQRLTGFLLWELLRMPVTNLFLFGGTGDLHRLRQAGQKTGTFHSQEGYHLRTMKEGVWIPVNLTVARLHIKPKTLALITARDVREQREAHDQLKTMEDEYRRVLAACSDCLWSAEINEQGQCNYRYFSAMVEKITGHSQNFFLESFNRWWALIHPDDQSRWEKAFVKLRSGQSTEAEYRMVRADGTVRWLRDVVQVVREKDRNVLRLDGVVSDITERKLAEFAQEDTQKRFETFMDQSPTVAFLKDQAGRFVYANKAYLLLVQRSSVDLIGKTDLDLFPAEVAKQLRANDAAVFAGDQPLLTTEVVPAPDGTIHHLQICKFPFEDGSGRRFLGGIALDTTERNSH